MDRCHIDQLLAFAHRPNRPQRSQCTGVALPAFKHRMVQNDAPTDESTNKEIGVIAEFLAPPIDLFGLTGGGRVIHQQGRQMGDPDRGIGGIDALSPGSGGPVDIDLDLILFDFDVDLFGLGAGYQLHRDQGPQQQFPGDGPDQVAACRLAGAARGWVPELEGMVRAKGLTPKTIYFFYTTCPKCAKVYGKNYIVGLARTD